MLNVLSTNGKEKSDIFIKKALKTYRSPDTITKQKRDLIEK